MTNRANPFLKLTAPGLPGLQPYIPGKPLSELERELGITNSIKLASNENPLGPGILAREAAAVALAELGRYPDGGGFELRRALAERHGLEADAVTLGNGSNDVLDLVARVFLHPDQESVFSEHAFAVYAISTQAVGATARVAKAGIFSAALGRLKFGRPPEDRRLSLHDDRPQPRRCDNPRSCSRALRSSRAYRRRARGQRSRA